jgi:hypothetical protein
LATPRTRRCGDPFAAEDVPRKLRPTSDVPDTWLSEVSPLAERILTRLCAADRRVRPRANLPFGSSVVLVGTKPLS